MEIEGYGGVEGQFSSFFLPNGLLVCCGGMEGQRTIAVLEVLFTHHCFLVLLGV
jgi:hypothetical protein